MTIDKKYIIIPLVLIIVFGGLGYAIYRLSQKDIAGYRLNLNFSKVETKDYTSYAPSLAFRYPTIFEIDLDKDQKYGKGYLVGIKLKTDDRTGCDVRTNGPAMDFNQTSDQLADQIVVPIREKAADLKVLEKVKFQLGGQDAFKVSFSFLDPIGARVRLDQIFAKSKDSNFMILCGTGEYQYEFFRKDFQVFYDSINFDGKLPEGGIK